MKYLDNEFKPKKDKSGIEIVIDNIFEEGKEAILHELISWYGEIKKKFQRGEIKKAPHERNMVQAFKELYHIEITEEEMIMIRDYVESGDYDATVQAQIDYDRNRGMRDVNLRGII